MLFMVSIIPFTQSYIKKKENKRNFEKSAHPLANQCGSFFLVSSHIHLPTPPHCICLIFTVQISLVSWWGPFTILSLSLSLSVYISGGGYQTNYKVTTTPFLTRMWNQAWTFMCHHLLHCHALIYVSFFFITTQITFSLPAVPDKTWIIGPDVNMNY